MKAACKDCAFWDHVEEDSGWCRVHAPVAVGSKYFRALAIWPITGPFAWCGEFKPKEKKTT